MCDTDKNQIPNVGHGTAFANRNSLVASTTYGQAVESIAIVCNEVFTACAKNTVRGAALCNAYNV